MAVVATTLVRAKYAENAQTTQYTSSGVRTIIDKMTVTNVTSSAVTFAANVVAGGNTASAADRIINSKTIQAGETYFCPELVGHILFEGAQLSTIAGATESLVLMVSGRQVS